MGLRSDNPNKVLIEDWGWMTNWMIYLIPERWGEIRLPFFNEGLSLLIEDVCGSR
jgi:hypothetical protein